MNQITIDGEFWWAMALLLMFLSAILYNALKPLNYSHFEPFEWVDYMRGSKQKSSQVLRITKTHLYMINGDIVFYRDVL